MRSPYRGLLNVVLFNWPMYAAALLVVMLALKIPWAPARLIGLGALYFLLSSLLASHYIYDLSDLYGWQWLRQRVSDPKTLVNIHSGFDETSSQLSQLFPEARIEVLDFYDPERNPEPSIARARRIFPPKRNSRPVDSRQLPLADGSCELVCCILAAHELRCPDQRAAFFAEIKRALRPDGRLLVVEHLRDLPNFLAFGPGFVHFFSRQDWLRAFSAGGLEPVQEFAINPFVRGFTLRACAP